MRFSVSITSCIPKPIVICLLLSTSLAACSRLFVTPQPSQRPDPATASRAIEAEQILPTQIVVRDFDFSSATISENASPLHRATDLFRHSSAEDRRVEIARSASANLSEQVVKRLRKVGLEALRIPGDSDAALPDNILLITGRLIDVDEGNRLTRVALGFGAGESSLNTEVQVFRVAHGERAEVLAFTTHADSGKMPGMAVSMGFGEMFLGPITLISLAESSVSSGQKIYSTQMNYLAGETGDQVAGYISQYSADESWITANKARSVNLITE